MGSKITAKEAYEVADSKSSENTKEDLEVCYKSIRERAKMGEFNVTLDRKISKKASLELRNDGYSVTVLSGNTHIMWLCVPEE